ncbi:MAG: M20/M25/M40 family metallo-hydrolase, partial [Desulfobacteraceae bacterium]|nr:M20/M25/M40 family metallo-hydrolase [Desulfobacteraceae bacterium]
FDENWEENGLLKQVCKMVEEWCLGLKIDGLTAEVITPKGKSPLILIEVEATSDNNNTTLIYGHLDKQPEFSGWDENKAPWKPVIENNRLYGRGAADDGYAVFSALCAIKALQEQNLQHNRFVILIESGEESGSPDLPYYIEKYKKRIKEVELIVCLDSGCGDYERFWVTNSLRGTAMGNLEIKILKQGIHSGKSGIAASSFRILRNLLDRIEDSQTGEIKLEELNPKIPHNTMEMIQKSVKILSKIISKAIPFVDGAKPVSDDPLELIINSTWKPVLSYIGIDGIPPSKHAGSVLRPGTSIALSLRLPPNIDANKAIELLKTTLEKNPPYNAQVSFNLIGSTNGWEMPEMSHQLYNAIDESSKAFFNNDVCFIGEGGSIPFMNLLLEKFPKAQFIVTGVLGPNANAHGPNEFLHIPYVKKLTCALSYIFASQNNKEATNARSI